MLRHDGARILAPGNSIFRPDWELEDYTTILDMSLPTLEMY